MASIQEIRAQYPQYDDMSDDDLAKALHGKYYSDMPYEDFAAKIGMQAPVASAKSSREAQAESFYGLARGGMRGLGRGAAMLAGLPADLNQLGQSATDWLVGVSPENRQLREDSPFAFTGPTSEKILGAINDATRPAPSPSQLATGEQPMAFLEQQPETTGEQYAQTIGEFAPAALAGPGGVARKAAMATIPAVASETAGQATKGQWYEPYARAGAAIVTGGLTAGGKGNVSKQIAKEAPDATSVKQAAGAAYDQLRNAGVTYDANVFRQMVTDLGQKIGRGFRSSQAPHSTSLLKELAQHVGRSPDYNDLESLRQAAGAVLREGGNSVLKSDKAVAAMLKEAIDDFTMKAPFATNGSLPAHVVNPMMKQARELARRNIIAEHVDEMMRKAETYQSGFDSGIRNQFGSYLRSKGKGLTKEEYRAFHDVNKGVSSANTVKSLGKFGFDVSRMASQASVVPSMIAGGLAYGGDPLSALLLAGVGTAARFASPRIHQNLADRAKKVALAGIPGQKKGLLAGRENQKKALLRGLLVSEPALMQGRDDRAPVRIR